MNDTTYKSYSPTGMLSDNGIRQYFKNGIDIYIDEKDGSSFDLDKQLHVGSVDLRFRHLCKRIQLENDSVLSYELLRNHSYTKPFELKDNDKLRIEPGEIIITTSLEIVNLSKDFAAIVTGRSSIARLGIMGHCCQEFIHPGHGQAIPLQIINLSPYPVELEQSVPICQIVFFRLATAASEKYTDRKDAKYSEETNPEGSKIYEDINSISYRDNSKKKGSRGKQSLNNTRKFVKKYISPFLPSAITFLVITPFLKEFVVDQTLSDIVTAFENLPAPIIVALILLIIFIFSKRGEDKWKYI